MRKLVISIALLAAANISHAQTPSPTAACGPAATHFKVDDGPLGAPDTPPAPGKATIYIIGFFNLKSKGAPTIRLGTDGTWTGATKHNAFLRIEVDPGPHHFCAEWQSMFKYLSEQISLYNFNADSGKTYFLRASVHADAGQGDTLFPYLDLSPVSEDEGRLLLSKSVQSISHEQK